MRCTRAASIDLNLESDGIMSYISIFKLGNDDTREDR